MTSVEAMQIVMNNQKVGARPVLAPWILIYDGFGWGKKYSTLKMNGRTIRGASVWPKEICAEWEIVEIRVGDIVAKESVGFRLDKPHSPLRKFRILRGEKAVKKNKT